MAHIISDYTFDALTYFVENYVKGYREEAFLCKILSDLAVVYKDIALLKLVGNAVEDMAKKKMRGEE